MKRLSLSETAKLNHLLTKLTLGDHTLSQLLREMKQLGGDKLSNDLLQCLCPQTAGEYSGHPVMCRFGVSRHVERRR